MRTIAEIYDGLIAEKENLTHLSTLSPTDDDFSGLMADLVSSSKVAIWRSLFYVMAFAIWTHEQTWNLFKLELEEAAFNVVSGSLRWIDKILREYQHGDSLSWNGKDHFYSAIDEGKRVVKFVSIKEFGSSLQVKVAKELSGVPEKLTVAEKNGLSDYLAERRFAGVVIAVVSEDADEVKMSLEVEVDAQVIDGTGESTREGGLFPVKDAISEYLSNLDFGGVFRKNHLIDSVQAVHGVIDVRVDSVHSKFAAGSYTEITHKRESNAGHMKLSESDSSITYIT